MASNKNPIAQYLKPVRFKFGDGRPTEHTTDTVVHRASCTNQDCKNDTKIGEVENIKLENGEESLIAYCSECSEPMSLKKKVAVQKFVPVSYDPRKKYNPNK